MVIVMAAKFLPPDFSSGDIELRIIEEEICIYATDAGLEKIISFCEQLRNDTRCEHIHLDDYGVLTKESLRGVIAKIK
jgi:GGDEF domain-containing protein